MLLFCQQPFFISQHPSVKMPLLSKNSKVGTYCSADYSPIIVIQPIFVLSLLKPERSLFILEETKPNSTYFRSTYNSVCVCVCVYIPSDSFTCFFFCLLTFVYFHQNFTFFLLVFSSPFLCTQFFFSKKHGEETDIAQELVWDYERQRIDQRNFNSSVKREETPLLI